MTNVTHTYLRTVIGLGNNAEGNKRAEAIMSKGLNDLADIYELVVANDGIKTLCSSVRKPTGTMAQPGWVAPNPNPNQLALLKYLGPERLSLPYLNRDS